MNQESKLHECNIPQISINWYYIMILHLDHRMTIERFLINAADCIWSYWYHTCLKLVRNWCNDQDSMKDRKPDAFNCRKQKELGTIVKQNTDYKKLSPMITRFDCLHHYEVSVGLNLMYCLIYHEKLHGNPFLKCTRSLLENNLYCDLQLMLF